MDNFIMGVKFALILWGCSLVIMVVILIVAVVVVEIKAIRLRKLTAPKK